MALSCDNGTNQFLLAVPTLNGSFMCANCLDCCIQASPSTNESIRLYIYIYIYIYIYTHTHTHVLCYLSRLSGSVQQINQNRHFFEIKRKYYWIRCLCFSLSTYFGLYVLIYNLEKRRHWALKNHTHTHTRKSTKFSFWFFPDKEVSWFLKLFTVIHEWVQKVRTTLLFIRHNMFKCHCFHCQNLYSMLFPNFYFCNLINCNC